MSEGRKAGPEPGSAKVPAGRVCGLGVTRARKSGPSEVGNELGAGPAAVNAS